MNSGWLAMTLGSFIHLQRGHDLPRQLRRVGSVPVLGANGPVGSHDSAMEAGPGVLLGRAGHIGKATFWPGPYWPLNTSLYVKDFRGNDPLFTYYLLDSMDFSSFNSGGAQPMLNRNFIAPIRIEVPPLREQHKIAEILRTWDDAIDKLTDARAAAQLRRSTIELRLFEARFNDPDTLVRAEVIFAPVSEKGRSDLPLLAVMQDVGVVRRDTLDRRVVMPESGTSGYKVVRPGDFVISLRSFEGGLEVSKEIGLISPAYTVLRAHRIIDTEYYGSFFKSRSFIARLDKLIFGIRDGKQIAFRDFGAMKIPAPDLQVQTREAELLDEFQRGIALIDSELEAITMQKRGLMQKLLTGEIRVTGDVAESSGEASIV